MCPFPLLIGKDLINRLEPVIDFKHSRIWAQNRNPLPFLHQQLVMADTLANNSATLCTPRTFIAHPWHLCDASCSIPQWLLLPLPPCHLPSLSMTSWDPAIRTMILHLSAPLVHRISDSDLDCVPDLTHLYHNRTSLRIVKGLLMYVSETLTSPLVVVP